MQFTANGRSRAFRAPHTFPFRAIKGTAMSKSNRWMSFHKIKFVMGGLVVLSLLTAGVQITAEDNVVAEKVYLVEEDWEVVLNDPEPKINSPQISFFLYPDSTQTDVYFQLQMNFAAEEGYSSGGFRVGAFQNEVPLDEERSVIREVWNIDGDKISWTSAMASWDNKLMYAVKNGSGGQWGTFGGPEYLVEMPEGEIKDLNDYDPQVSIQNVDISFGKNRIASIRLKRVKVTYTNGRTQTIDVNLWAKKP